MKAILFANTDWYLFNFRLPLAEAMRRQGWDVILVSPGGDYAHKLVERKFRWAGFNFSRQGVNPFQELISLLRLIRFYHREKPELVHHFTIKSVIYGGIAARVLGIPGRVNALTGLGHLFTTHSLSNRMLRPIVRMLYRQATYGSLCIFQNPDDRAEFIRHKLIAPESARLIRGSGVDVQRFQPPAEAKSSDMLTVIMVARLILEKGVREFVEAAALVSKEFEKIEFLIAGDVDPGNPSSMSPAELKSLGATAKVQFLGHQDNVLALLQRSDVAVLPSYREGTPRSLLEAAACGLPLIATDVPGCREVVVNGENGLLVPAADPHALAEALLKLARDPKLRASMGMRSRQRVVDEFEEGKVLRATLAVQSEAMPSCDRAKAA